MRAMTHLVIRFLLEVAALAAAGVVGASAGSRPLGFVGGLVAVGAFVVVWGLWIAPRARFTLAPMARHVIGTAIMLAAAIGIVLIGQPTLGEVLAALILANAVFLVIGGADPLPLGGRA
jgi:hypothetical protein